MCAQPKAGQNTQPFNIINRSQLFNIPFCELIFVVNNYQCWGDIVKVELTSNKLYSKGVSFTELQEWASVLDKSLW